MILNWNQVRQAIIDVTNRFDDFLFGNAPNQLNWSQKWLRDLILHRAIFSPLWINIIILTDKYGEDNKHWTLNDSDELQNVTTHCLY